MTTYLYIKRHKKTGLKYFGKTSRKNPFEYCGSGKYWLRHIKSHGFYDVETLEVWGFDDLSLCSSFALKFSKDHDIVNSSDWANLKPENGLDGGTAKTNKPLSPEHKAKISQSLKGRVMSEAAKQKASKALKGRIRSEEHSSKISKARLGKKMPPVTEEHRLNLSKSRLGKKHSEETKEKQSEAKVGSKNPFFGKKHSEETKKRMSESAKLARSKRRENG